MVYLSNIERTLFARWCDEEAKKTQEALASAQAIGGAALLPLGRREAEIKALQLVAAKLRGSDLGA
jgi:hypothetical protein